MTYRACAVLAFASLMACSLQAPAQPSNAPVRLVVPVAAGGPTDQAARLIAHAMAQALGQDVIVDNRPGASGAIGAQAVAVAPADGGTLLFATGGMAGLPMLMKNPPFASLTEFTPLGAVGGVPLCLFVHPSLAARTVQELITYARAHPDQLSYGSSTPGEYLSTAQLIQATGVRMVRIPYKGSAQMMPDFLEGRVQLAITPAVAGAPHVKTGRLKVLACNMAQRLPALPEVPTLAEAGVPDIGQHVVHWVLAPARMAPALGKRLAAAVEKAAQEPAVRAEFERLYLTVTSLNPVQTTEAIRDSERIWAKFVREAGITPE